MPSNVHQRLDESVLKVLALFALVGHFGLAAFIEDSRLEVVLCRVQLLNS
jgi:hypothetical protein